MWNVFYYSLCKLSDIANNAAINQWTMKVNECEIKDYESY